MLLPTATVPKLKLAFATLTAAAAVVGLALPPRPPQPTSSRKVAITRAVAKRRQN
jgi:hypothetical protein